MHWEDIYTIDALINYLTLNRYTKNEYKNNNILLIIEIIRNIYHTIYNHNLYIFDFYLNFASISVVNTNKLQLFIALGHPHTIQLHNTAFKKNDIILVYLLSKPHRFDFF